MIKIVKAKFNPVSLAEIVWKTLPAQGCIEVQHDQPGKEHKWHEHQTDETIIVLEGSLKFYFNEGERICAPGDVIFLPARSPHGSLALEQGATYLIAFHDVNL